MGLLGKTQACHNKFIENARDKRVALLELGGGFNTQRKY